jgi:hypothetical protein
VKPATLALWIFTIVLAVGLTRLVVHDSADSGADSDGSFLEAFGELEPLQRAYLISRSLRDLSPDNLPELLEAIKVRRMGIVWEEVRLIMIAWARFDPRGAWEWANQGDPSWRPTLTDQAIYAWAYQDGPAARSIVEAIDEPEWKVRLRASMIDGWLRSPDKAGVSDYIANFDDIRRRGRLIFLLAGEIMMEKGREGAMRWVEAIPDDAPNDFKAGVFAHIIKMIAADDPRVAADWFLEHRTQPYTEDALEGIARRWAQHQKDPAELFAWLLALDVDGIEEADIDGALGTGFRAWLQTDSEAAQAWLGSALPNPRLDVAIVEAIRYLQAPSPDLAMAWAQRVQDEALREKRLVQAGRRWREKDPEALQVWLNEGDLPEDVQQKILRAPVNSMRLNLAPKAPNAPGAAGAGKP